MDQSNEAQISQVERVIALRPFPGFTDLPPADLAVVAELGRPRLFRKGTTILRPGIRVRSLFFIIQGRAHVVREGKPALEMGAHDVVGGLAALTQEPEGQHVVALEDTLTLQLDSDDMEDIFEDHLSILLAVLRVLARTQITARRRLGGTAGFAAPGGLPPVREIRSVGLVERIFLLRRSMDFASTRVEALADLAQEATLLEIAPGHVLWRAGDIADHAVVLISGQVVCETEDTLQRFTFGPSAVVGGTDSLADAPRWYNARAEGVGRALRIERSSLLDVMEDHMEMGLDMLRLFARAVRSLQDRLTDPHSALDQPVA